MKMLIIFVAAISGCISGTNTQAQPSQGGSASYLCVGMEYSQRFGDCPGCKVDATKMSDLMKGKMGYRGEVLISAEATKDAVVKKLKEGIESTPEDGLFLFFYSGHGGQEFLGGKEPDGADRDDEFLCLYDTYMLDDEIWEIVSKCRGRVFLYFDACHSATMYRSVASERKMKDLGTGATALAVNIVDLAVTTGFTFRPERMVKARASSLGRAVQSPRILCWSGCKEREYSYGGSNGGTLTTAVVYCWQRGRSYESLWESAVKLVNAMQQGAQNPVQTRVGDGFPKDMEAFR